MVQNAGSTSVTGFCSIILSALRDTKTDLKYTSKLEEVQFRQWLEYATTTLRNLKYPVHTKNILQVSSTIIISRILHPLLRYALYQTILKLLLRYGDTLQEEYLGLTNLHIIFQELNEFLELNSYLVEHRLTVIDLIFYYYVAPFMVRNLNLPLKNFRLF